MAGVDSREGIMEEVSTPQPKDGAVRSNRTKSASKKRTPTPVTVPQPFNLGLSKRVEERQQYRTGLAKKQKAAEDREKVRREEMEEEERINLKEYRKKLDFKATPIQKYPVVTINPSSKELTCPSAPKLSTSIRSKGSQSDSSMDGSMSQQSSNSLLPVS